MVDNANETVLAVNKEIAAEDERLVQECLNGDERAWNTLIDKYKRSTARKK